MYIGSKLKSDKHFVNEHEINDDTSTSTKSLSNIKTIIYGNISQPSTPAAASCQKKDNLANDYDRWVNNEKLEISKSKYLHVI